MELNTRKILLMVLQRLNNLKSLLKVEKQMEKYLKLDILIQKFVKI